MTAQLRLAALESVRCLECERTYAKPVAGGTVWSNPGCPHCGYVGWIPASAPFAGARARHRHGVRRRRVLLEPSR